MSETRARQTRGRGSVYLGLAGGLFLASGGLLGGYFLLAGDGPRERVQKEDVAEPGGAKVDEEALQAVRATTEEFVASEATIRWGEEQVTMPWSELGVSLDEEASIERTARLSATAEDPAELDYDERVRRAGGLPIAFDRDTALGALMELKERYDRSPRNAYLDLEGREVVEEREGFGVDAYASLAAIENAARAGHSDVDLVGVPIPAEVTVEDLGIDDVSHVLADFTTEFSARKRSRTYNLKVAASKLNGYVLKPGEVFSFNDVVGARTEKEGYKIAPVITKGELVDGLAGGTCQISSTLHGAAFFAGIGIERSVPHSRPSSYVTMGLDATVVYPYVDLELVNNYDFPVVIHFTVARGKSTVRILGKERPYDKIVFERELEETLEFETVTREDPEMPVGSMVIDQAGFFGYKLERRRKYYDDGKLVKRDKWKLRYRPVTEYARIGINPDPNLPPPENDTERHGPKVPKKDSLRIVR